VITISEVIEQCALEAEAFEPRYDDNRIAEAIRALAAQYAGCIVAEGSPAARAMGVPLYCAKEPETCKPALQVKRADPRRPLTDEEILKAVGWETAEMYFKLTPGFPVAEARAETLKNARAIERAHKIGGNDE
jgi:hypothetical protein